ncbi:MAG: hypothetical protein Q8Q36_02735 [bacterium]|nr:hypothetical protein [bacterium]
MHRSLNNLLFRLKAASDRDPEKFALAPARDWALAVGVFLAAVSLAAAGSAYLYLAVNRNEAFSLGAPESKKEAVTKERLDEALSYLEEKEGRFERILTNKTRFADPSK